MTWRYIKSHFCSQCLRFGVYTTQSLLFYCLDVSNTNDSLQWRHNERDCVSNHQPQPFIQDADQRKQESIKAPRHRPLWGEFTGDKGPVTRKMFPSDDVIMSVAVRRLHTLWQKLLSGLVTDYGLQPAICTTCFACRVVEDELNSC